MIRALRPAISLCAFVLLGAPAGAEKALEHHAAPMLVAAAERAAAHAEHQYAFTVDHWGAEGDTEMRLKLRFDPRLEGGERWTLLEPSRDDLGKAGRKALKAIQNIEAEGHPLLYDRLGEMIEEAELAGETEAEAVFVAQVDEDGLPRDALEVFITLDKAGGYISRIDVKSKKPFKPMPIAKVEHLVQTQYFAAPHDGGPAFLARTEGVVEGDAMFRHFKSETRQVFSDIERVELEGARAGEEPTRHSGPSS